MEKISENIETAEVSRLASGLFLKGEVNSEGDIRIDGTVEGDIKSAGKIVVGEGASIKGRIFCSVLDFAGTLDGEIYVKDTLSIKKSADIKGNVFTARIQVELGASINGTFKMFTSEEYEKVL